MVISFVETWQNLWKCLKKNQCRDCEKVLHERWTLKQNCEKSIINIERTLLVDPSFSGKTYQKTKKLKHISYRDAFITYRSPELYIDEINTEAKFREIGEY